jgi:cell division septum initiation protein DivIVA|tara:strand:+ start:51 stop:392 length:342 start_codon:yes stop_codon:yes gene_type:complete
VSIEFNNQDSRLGYLNEKLDDLLEGINSSYGEELFNELVLRLERTINDFNEEISELTEAVKGNSEKRAEIIHTLMEGSDSTATTQNSQDNTVEGSNLDSEIMSEWEKRLEGLK